MAELEEEGPVQGLETQEALLIVNLRIYDVLMAILAGQNDEEAANLYNIHAQGGFVSSSPFVDPDYLARLQQSIVED